MPHVRKLLAIALPGLVIACGSDDGSASTADGSASATSTASADSATTSTAASGNDTSPTTSMTSGTGASDADTSDTNPLDDGSTTSASMTAGTDTTASDTTASTTEAASTSGADSTTGDDAGSTTGDDMGNTTTSTTGNPIGMDACGFPEDGPWVEIEYNQVGGSPQSPSWTFSNTPGWGGAQWAMQGDSWPEVWDVWQNINVSNDPIGVLAVVGPGAELQLMMGLEELIDYDYASVCVEGRSVSATASVIFAVYNPLNDCGVANLSMAHDWVMHAEGVDLGACMVPGGGVQAVRVEPTGGSSAIGIKRMRVTLHGAVY